MALRLPFDRESAAWRWGMAIVIAAAAICLRVLLDPVLGRWQTHVAGTIAAVVTAVCCGTGPAILALVAATAASFRLFVMPSVDPGESLTSPIASAVVSIITNGLLVWLIDSLQHSRRVARLHEESATRAETRLRERDSYLREFIDHSSAFVYVRDLEGRFLLVNERCRETYPKVKGESPESSQEYRFTPELAERFATNDSRVIATGTAQTFEQSIPLEDGDHQYVTVKFPILDAAGRIFAVGGVSTDVTALHHARADLQRTDRVLRSLIEVQEQEKQLLCGEFHDGLIQYAVGAKMLLESLSDGHLDPPDAETVHAATDYLARGIEDGRRVIHGIRPAELDDLGLGAAVLMLVDDLEVAGIHVAATIEPAACDVPRSFQVTIFRIIQEALSNVRRHSGSDRARIELRREGDAIAIVVEDFGVGSDRDSSATLGFGIAGMKERARLLEGECRVVFRAGLGTLVTARLPIHPGQDRATGGVLPPMIPAEHH